MKLELRGAEVFQLGGYLKGMEESREFSFSVRRRLMKFNKVLQPEFEMIQKEAQKITEEYVEKDENGSPKIENGAPVYIKDKQKEMLDKLSEIENEVITLEFEEFKLPEKVFDNFACSASVIEIVEKNFLEEEE